MTGQKVRPLAVGVDRVPEEVKRPAAEAPPADVLTLVDAVDFARHIESPDSIWDGVLIRSYLYAITAHTGHGKTAFALLLAVCVALGRTLAGRATEPGRVLYIAGENPDDVRKRLVALCEHLGVPIDELRGRLSFIDRSFVLTERLVELAALIDGFEPILVITDTDQAISGSEEENDNPERIAHAKRLRALTRLKSSPTVVDLCHPAASAMRTSLRPRGGSGFLAEIDGNLGMWKDDTTEEFEVFRTSKFRGALFEPIAFALREVFPTGITDSKGRPIACVVAEPTSAEEDAQRVQQAHQRHLAILRDVSTTPSSSLRERQARLSIPRTTLSRGLDSLVGAGAIRPALSGHEVTDKGKKWLVAAV